MQIFYVSPSLIDNQRLNKQILESLQIISYCFELYTGAHRNHPVVKRVKTNDHRYMLALWNHTYNCVIEWVYNRGGLLNENTKNTFIMLYGLITCVDREHVDYPCFIHRDKVNIELKSREQQTLEYMSLLNEKWSQQKTSPNFSFTKKYLKGGEKFSTEYEASKKLVEEIGKVVGIADNTVKYVEAC